MIERVQIGDRFIGKEEPVFIIGEIGSNHDRNLNQAKELIDAACDSGVDAVKFQLFKAESLYFPGSPIFAIFKANELPREWIGELAEHARKRGVVFLATPFDKEAVDELYEAGVPAYKCASPETYDLPFLKYVAAKKKPIILSTAMCNLGNIQEDIDIITSTGNKDIILLHCTASYPTEPHHVNLRMMDTMSNAFYLPVGFSDHTMGIAIPLAAAARGACVIEKHITLSRKLNGPDHSYALEPHELKQMVKAIREIRQSLGSPVKEFIRGLENPKLHRKSIISKTYIPKAQIITEDIITVKRSADGIDPRFMDVIIGRKTQRDIKEDEVITWEMI